MYDNLTSSDYISLIDAARLVPNRPHYNTLWRWANKGVRTRDGERIRLRTRRFGGKIWTTRTWIEQFADRLSEVNVQPEQRQPSARSLHQNNRTGSTGVRPEQAAARRFLETEGIG